MKFERFCPRCGKQLWHKTKKHRNRAVRKQQICKSCSAHEIQNRPDVKAKGAAFKSKAFKGDGNPFYGKKHTAETINKIVANTDRSVYKTNEYRQKMSDISSGKNNPMYGKSVYALWIEKYGVNEANRLQAELSCKRSANATGTNNPMYGKPSPKGSGNGWSGWYKGWYFRSLKELSYMIYVIEANQHQWESAEKKKYTIPYVDINGVHRTYRADFLIDSKLLVEIKPKALMETATNIQKRDAAFRYCAAKGLEYRMIDVKTIDALQLLELCRKGIVKLCKNKFSLLEQKYERR